MDYPMKKLIILGLCLISTLSALAQDPTNTDLAQDQKAQEKIKNLRIAYISDKLSLTPEQAEKFWPVYREFSDQRKEIRQEMIDARKQIKTDNPDQAQQEQLVKLGLTLKQRELDLEKTYSERLMRVITAQQILSLRKAEGDFQRLILEQVQQRRMMQQRNETLRERNQQLKQQRN
jgi:Spy/CpxP family protein refolding chaperone